MDATFRLGALILGCVTAWGCEHPAAVSKAPSGQGSATTTANGPRSSLRSGAAKPRLMIVGDSISAGPGCYKKYLLQALAEHHYSNFEFVGEYADDCGGAVRHSAVSCSTAEQYTAPSFTMPNCFQGKYF